jgi:hypothetical protein
MNGKKVASVFSVEVLVFSLRLNIASSYVFGRSESTSKLPD